jgi:hypothetical protein
MKGGKANCMLENEQESMENCREVRECLEILVNEIYSGYHFLGIFNHLNENRQKFPEVNHELFYLIYDIQYATLETSYFYLVRVLEYADHISSKNRPITFRHFLNIALEKLECFSHTGRLVVRKKIKADQQWASPKNNKKIQYLKDLRNNYFAHIGRKRLESSDTEKINSIFKFESRDPVFINGLYREVGQKLNEYNEMLNGAQIDIFGESLPNKEEEKLYSILAKELDA